MFHISDGESSERRVFREGLNNHRLGGNELNHGRVSGLDRSGFFLHGFSGSLVDQSEDLLELASNVASVAIQHRRVSVADLSRVFHNDNLSSERYTSLGGILLGVRGNTSSADFLD